MNNRTEQIKAEIDRAKGYAADEKDLAIKLLLDGWESEHCPRETPAAAALEVLDHAESARVDEWEQAQWEAHCRDQIGPLATPGLLQPKDLLY